MIKKEDKFTLKNVDLFFKNILKKDNVNDIIDDIISTLMVSLYNENIFKFKFVQEEDENSGFEVWIHVFDIENKKKLIELIKDYYINIEKYEVINELNELINIIEKEQV